jgi:hypothetical protein
MTRRIEDISEDIQRTRAEAAAIKTGGRAPDITKKAELKRKLAELTDEKREWIRSGTVDA